MVDPRERRLNTARLGIRTGAWHYETRSPYPVIAAFDSIQY